VSCVLDILDKSLRVNSYGADTNSILQWVGGGGFLFLGVKFDPLFRVSMWSEYRWNQRSRTLPT